MPSLDPDELPEWPPGTVAILSTGAGSPHAIPVSTGVRAGPRRALIALARRRESLQRLRDDPRVALTILAGDDVAITAHATARVLQDPMEVSDRVAAVALEVTRIQDHNQPRFVIESGARWRWADEEAKRRDAEIRAALTDLAESLT